MQIKLDDTNLVTTVSLPLLHRAEGAYVPELAVHMHAVLLQDGGHLIASVVVVVDADGYKGVTEYIKPDDRDIDLLQRQVGKKLKEIKGHSDAKCSEAKLSKTMYFEIMQE